jgi:excisionase family DNA binding protein
MHGEVRTRGAPRLLTYREAAERLGITEAALRKRISTGKIPRIAFGPRSCRIDEHDLEAYIEEGRRRGEGGGE